MSITRTENEAKCFDTTGSACLDFFSKVGGMRGDKALADSMFQKAFNENPTIAMYSLLYLRDTRNGIGERQLFRDLFKINFNQFKTTDAFNMIKSLSEIGRWDDVINIFDYIVNYGNAGELACLIRNYLITTFKEDIKNAKKGKDITLLGKWIPSPSSHNPNKRKIAKYFANYLGLTERNFRKQVSFLRSKLNIVETEMCNKNWNKIDYSSVPSLAMKKYNKAFERNSIEYKRYLNKVEKGLDTINTKNIFPYQFYRSFEENGYLTKADEILWDNLPNYIDPNLGDILVMPDVSGSMEGLPMATSISLATYFAERNQGFFKNKYLSFTDVPRLIEIIPSLSLDEKFKRGGSHVGYNTNLEGALSAVYYAAYTSDYVPKALVIISDGEIDCFMSAYDYESIIENCRKKFETINLKFPKVVFWNVDARNSNQLALGTENVSFISGLSSSIFQHMEELIALPAYDAMIKILEHYSCYFD